MLWQLPGVITCVRPNIYPFSEVKLLFAALMEFLMAPKMGDTVASVEMAHYVALRLVSFRGEPKLFCRHIPADKG